MRKLKSIILTAALVLATGTANAQFDETNNLFYHTIRTPHPRLILSFVMESGISVKMVEFASFMSRISGRNKY